MLLFLTWDCFQSENIAVVFLFNFTDPQTGLNFEIWDGITGSKVDDLRNNPKFPNNPSTTHTLIAFDTPYNRADNYGARVTTYYLVSTLVQRLYAVAPIEIISKTRGGIQS